MSNSDKSLQAVRLRGYIGPDRKLEITESPDELPEGDVEIILLYPNSQSDRKPKRPSPSTWPVLNGGRYLGGTLSREEIYGDDGR